jgi:hypothetical protein
MSSLISFCNGFFLSVETFVTGGAKFYFGFDLQVNQTWL